jgi:hypothetical protein
MEARKFAKHTPNVLMLGRGFSKAGRVNALKLRGCPRICNPLRHHSATVPSLVSREL